MLIRFNNRLVSLLKIKRRFATKSALNDDEYTATPQYPPILDNSLEKRKEREQQSYHDEIRAVKTVEEKQIKLNMPRYYGFKCYMLHDDKVPYNNLEFIQFITRTHLIQDRLPEYYNKLNTESLVNVIKADIEELLLLEYGGYRKIHETEGIELSKSELENNISTCVAQHVNRALLNNLLRSHEHLANTTTDIDPRIESFWYVGGMTPPEAVRKSRRGVKWLKDRENDPVDRPMQYIGTPSLTLRSEVPLVPVISYGEAHNTSLEVPFFKYDPRICGILTEYRRLVNTPGFWPGESHLHGILSYQRRGYLIDRKYDENDEALHRQGILSSFGWLNAQANFLGFTTYNDITYPLVSQCIITNGQIWSFYTYQLNTISVHSKNAVDNVKRNICWATKEMKLFEEIRDNKVVGLNEDVLNLLVKFYINKPERRSIEMTPYLDKEHKVIADYEDSEKREWLEREYKFLTANRPRYYLPYEIYNWEKIYKIDHKTRPFDARRRPFELFINPYKRTLDDRKPNYIPRKLRPDLPRHKGRNAKEYFP